MPPVIIGPRCNRRVTCDSNPSNDRSESALAINPLNPYQMVGSSKRFTDPHTYAFSLAAYYSSDGGQSWNDASPLQLLTQGDPGYTGDTWVGTSDPAVAWDNMGNVYILALPFGVQTPADPNHLIGIAVYKSTDGGRTWSPPNLIHTSNGDDKQWIAGDNSSASPHAGNVYAAWDDGAGIGGSALSFARTTDHGVTWKGIKIGGVDQAAGTHLPGIGDSGAPEISVAADGTVHIVWFAGDSIKFVKSTDGGASFSPPVVVAANITPIPGNLPGGTFRTFSAPTGCTGSGNTVVFAWADFREGVSRIYYRRSGNAGKTWDGPASGQPLLTGAALSPAGRHDFHPQLISTPSGEIGCTFYEFWTGSGTPPAQFIDVILAVSTNNGTAFPNRVTVTDHPWDPTVDEVWAHGDPNVTFIGDYFGFDASRLGFYPFWTDTRTGVQEIFTSRIAVNPADVYVRDSSSDDGDVPSPGNHWEAVDLIVRRQPDGQANFVNEDLLRDGVTDHYIYARATNRGPNQARNVRLAVIVGNYPSLLGLPGSEFRYPQDWYPGDWDTPALQSKHLYLGESGPIVLANGATRIIGPVVWPAAQIPDPATWHPCLLAEVRTDNDDSAGGPNGSPLPAEGDINACNFGSYFWGDNNICQRNLSYATVVAGKPQRVILPFLIGNAASNARFVEITIDKGRELADVPMTLRCDPNPVSGKGADHPHDVGDIVFVDGGRALVRVATRDVGEIIAAPGTIWRPPAAQPTIARREEMIFGAEKHGQEWQLTQSRASVGFPVDRGETRRATLAFAAPATLKPDSSTLVRIFQRNDKQTVTGSVILELRVAKSGEAVRQRKVEDRRAQVRTPKRRTKRVG